MRMYHVLAIPAFFASASAIAACSGQNEDQTIELQKAGSAVEFVDKSHKNGCKIAHDKKDRFLRWRFKDLASDCDKHNGNAEQDPEKDSECQVKLVVDSIGTESRKDVNCKSDNSDYVCEINVNRFKSVCNKVDPDNQNTCTLTYFVYYKGLKVDPTIIINPRPALD